MLWKQICLKTFWFLNVCYPKILLKSIHWKADERILVVTTNKTNSAFKWDVIQRDVVVWKNISRRALSGAALDFWNGIISQCIKVRVLSAVCFMKLKIQCTFVDFPWLNIVILCFYLNSEKNCILMALLQEILRTAIVAQNLSSAAIKYFILSSNKSDNFVLSSTGFDLEHAVFSLGNVNSNEDIMTSQCTL